MKAYVVGGAVRDSLLGLAVTDRDWVVVGETPASMRARGFRPVGRAFPVFLHPDTGEEYALARTERKDGHGHQGFAFAADATVTLEEDLRRRDLTVNAIARDENGVLIDPCGGVADLQQRILRHVSPAFIEDPLRVLRVARFYARFAHLGFRVAPATVTLMRDLSRSGELATLSGERIVMEWTKAMATASPQCFFILLSEVDAIAPLWPALFADGGQSAWEATMHRISTGSDVTLRLVASMTHCADIEALLSRYILPKRQARLCQLFHNYGRRLLAAPPADAADWHHLLQRLDIMRRPDDATDWLQLVQARYHLGDEDALIRRLHAAWRAYTSITTVAADGNNYAKALRAQRCAAITAALA